MQASAMGALAARDHEPFLYSAFVFAYTRTVIIRFEMTFLTFGADIFTAFIEKYIVRLAGNLIESSWFYYQMSSRSHL